MIVAVVYYRSGYQLEAYPTAQEWDTRLLIERSRAIKCPSIQYHLAGTKKVSIFLQNVMHRNMFYKTIFKIYTWRKKTSCYYIF